MSSLPAWLVTGFERGRRPSRSYRMGVVGCEGVGASRALFGRPVEVVPVELAEIAAVGRLRAGVAADVLYVSACRTGALRRVCGRCGGCWRRCGGGRARQRDPPGRRGRHAHCDAVPYRACQGGLAGVEAVAAGASGIAGSTGRSSRTGPSVARYRSASELVCQRRAGGDGEGVLPFPVQLSRLPFHVPPAEVLRSRTGAGCACCGGRSVGLCSPAMCRLGRRRGGVVVRLC